MKCEIIQDLMPSYIDGLTSAESNIEMEQHLNTCQKCKDVLEQMKAEVNAENVAFNVEGIKPFKKLNKRILQSILITLTACVLIAGSYFYLFAIGWKVNSDDMNITYSYDNEDSIQIDFALKNGKVLNHWIERTDNPDAIYSVIRFTECFSSVLDDRGEHPNQFSFGIKSVGEDGKIKTFSDDDCIILHFKDKTETLYLKEIVEELTSLRERYLILAQYPPSFHINGCE